MAWFFLNLFSIDIHHSNMKKVIVNLFLLALVANIASGLRLPQFFGNGMVLQKAPERAQVWGWLEGAQGAVSAQIQCNSGEPTTVGADLVILKYFYNAQYKTFNFKLKEANYVWHLFLV